MGWESHTTVFASLSEAVKLTLTQPKSYKR